MLEESLFPKELFSNKILEGIPDPARRYLTHAIAPGTPLASSVTITMRGSIRLKPRGAWLSMRAKQIIAAPRGFVWKASIGKGPIRITGADCYFDGSAELRFWLWGLIPLVKAAGMDIVKSAAGRLAIETCWLPSVWLPQHGARWEPVDEESTRICVSIGGEELSVLLQVGPNGELRRLSMQRWGDKTKDGSFVAIPFAAEVEEERNFDGYTIPTRVSVGWWHNTESYFEFFRAAVEHAEFR
ncbi:MAG: hypothetical protein KAT58_11655 [candidate division Zixibacteria bacterium]|nr:hypothetical protein [candidate division Zixibacteria bacterium]